MIPHVRGEGVIRQSCKQVGKCDMLAVSPLTKRMIWQLRKGCAFS